VAARSKARRRGSLVVVGTGIKVAAHATLETVAAIERADRLFYLVTEPATAAWLSRLNQTAATLDDVYAEGKPRAQSYLEMSARIMEAVRAGHQVCAAFYGHPGVFVNASHYCIDHLRLEGYDCRMLPGVSAEDCLFADLGVNPGDYGLASFEATDFLASRRVFDPRSELVLWQVGALGEGSVRKGMVPRPERIEKLTASLRKHYPANHPIVIYEAPCFPGCAPYVRRLPLRQLPTLKMRPMMTVYVPPRPQRLPDPAIAKWFDEP
jgi:uncharacterized protein YabN with tetrapyrrole methylase and pyrophosphatase domain